MKLALLLFTCSWLTLTDASKKSIENFIERFKDKPFLHAMATIVYSVFPILIMGLAGFFIFFQNELDSVIVIFLTFTVVYYVAGTKAIHTYISGGLLALGGLIAALSLRTPYRLSRVQAFWQILVHGEPLGDSKRGDAFQVWNGLIALGSGGLFGVGYGNSRLKLFYLQEAAYTDSIFAIIGEEFGIFGTILVILGFLLFLSLGLNIAKNAETKFASLIAIGITAWVTIQAFLNIASNLALIPFGGLPLPFYSYGGSNTIMLLIACGILLNISRKPKL